MMGTIGEFDGGWVEVWWLLLLGVWVWVRGGVEEGGRHRESL